MNNKVNPVIHREVWWQDYRRRQRRPNIKNFSKEDIFRIVWNKTTKEYIANCSLAGVKHMTEDKILLPQRLLWIAIFCVMFGGIFYFLKYLWLDNLARPLIVNMESTTYPIENISFPAVVICNFNRISRKALQKFVLENYSRLAKHGESNEEMERFFRQLGRLIDFTHDLKLQTSPFMDPFAKYIGNTENITKLMQQLAPSCEELLVKCWWGGQVKNCSDLFSVQKTVHGHCCTFNYALKYDSNGKPKSLETAIKRQYKSGLVTGLSVILDPMVEDTAYTLNHIHGFEIFLFDATHVADPSLGRTIYGFVQPNERINYRLHSATQLAKDEVKKFTSRTRNCLFRDERPSEFNNMYSYSACIAACRVRTIYSLCRCTPYFLPAHQKRPNICSLDDLKCLNKYKEKFQQLYPINTKNLIGLEPELQDAVYCPECLPDCEAVHHDSSISRRPISNISQIFRTGFLSDINMTGKSWLRIYYPTDYGVLNHLDVVVYWFEILSNVGGFCGILIGGSIISLLEHFYYTFIRFPINLHRLYFQ